MTVAILRPPKPKSRKIEIEGSTAVSGAPADGATPLFEASLPEMLGVRKFLIYAIEDTKMQLSKASQDQTIRRKEFLQLKEGAVLITAWAVDALSWIDFMLQESASKAPTGTTQ